MKSYNFYHLKHCKAKTNINSIPYNNTIYAIKINNKISEDKFNFKMKSYRKHTILIYSRRRFNNMEKRRWKPHNHEKKIFLFVVVAFHKKMLDKINQLKTITSFLSLKAIILVVLDLNNIWQLLTQKWTWWRCCKNMTELSLPGLKKQSSLMIMLQKH